MSEYILKSKTSKESIDQDFYTTVNLENNSRQVPVSVYEKVLSLTSQSAKEQDGCFKYRFNIDTNFVASNVLFNFSGDTSYETVLSLRYDPDEELDANYDYDLDEVLFEDNGWFFYNSGETCDKIFLEPTPERFTIDKWDTLLTYPASADVETLYFNGNKLENGISIYKTERVYFQDRFMTACYCALPHLLSNVDKIRIFGLTTFQGDFSVYKIGLPNGDYTDVVFVLDIDTSTTNLSSSLTTFKRLFGGVESKYYSRWAKTLTSNFDGYNTAFCTNLFADKQYTSTHLSEVDLSNIFDNRGRPISEIFVTYVKQTENEFWQPIQVGLSSSEDYNILNLNTTVTGIETNSGLYFLDIVEWNDLTQKEQVVVKAQHRTNTTNRESLGFFEGYYYYPHYRIELKRYSESVNNLQEQTNFYDTLLNNRYLSRDLLKTSQGSLNISYMNGKNYVYQKNNVLLKRQNPCDVPLVGIPSIIDGVCPDFTEVIDVPLDIC